MTPMPQVLHQIFQATQTNRAYNLAKDFGWVDGGCWMLANAIREVLPGSHAVSVREKGNPQIEHIATEYKGWYIDGAGVFTKEYFRNYWENDPVDGLGPITIEPFDLDQVPGPKYLDPYRDRAAELAAFFRQRLKPPVKKIPPRRRSLRSHRAAPSGLSGLR